MNHLANPLRVADEREFQLAEVRALNYRLELTNRDLGRELSGARDRIAELEYELSEARASAARRIGQLEQRLGEAPAAPLPLRYRCVDRCVRVVKRLPLLPALLRSVRRGVLQGRR